MSSRPEVESDRRYEDLAYGHAVRINDFKDELSPTARELLRRANDEHDTFSQIALLMNKVKTIEEGEQWPFLVETKNEVLKFLQQAAERCVQVKARLGARRPAADMRVRVLLSTPRYENEDHTDLLVRVAKAIRRGDTEWTVDIDSMEIVDEMELA